MARNSPPPPGPRAIMAARYRAPEAECVSSLLELARLSEAEAASAAAIAQKLLAAIKQKQNRSGLEALIHEYSLSSEEGVALMCLAEALLRIPDAPTRDALIRDKICAADWRSHLGHSPSPFVNATTWGLVVAGTLMSSLSERSLGAALLRLVAKGGEPLIRKSVDIAMRLLGEQFVMAQTIDEALSRAQRLEAAGFRYSYDMLGEAAVTAADAERYVKAYAVAIEAIGKASAGRGVYEGPGVSIKLSALSPRFSPLQRARVMDELYGQLFSLASLAASRGIGLNIDAEECERFDLTLDLFEKLLHEPSLRGWNGIGFVVQAYQKRAPLAVEFLIDLAGKVDSRIMVRLVKGAYWDSEIKRAQVDGQQDYPVFTRKVHTDVCYLACARKLLAAKDRVFAQFATHNARTLANVLAMAGENFSANDYEFQCLHGMGEPIYEEVVGKDKLGRPCRIYAPVGSHETLLSYLVRRLIENGANTSFVNQIANPDISDEELLADPAERAQRVVPFGSPHPAIVLPRDLYAPERWNSEGFDFSSESELAILQEIATQSARMSFSAGPLVAAPTRGHTEPRVILNPANRDDTVGEVSFASAEEMAKACEVAAREEGWGKLSPRERAACLERAADLLEARRLPLLGLIVREAGKTFPAAVAEVREAVDYLRYYAAEARRKLANAVHKPIGPVACISPWNFPLAIFTGQVAAALAAGNPVLAKPAEETCLIAAEAVRILHEAGVPPSALQFLPGAGDVGAALVANPAVKAVAFTGSGEVAKRIERELVKRAEAHGRGLPLIAETGGINAMVVDSSALSEQVITDVLVSAFDSAGQRCSALRVLCLQDVIADRIIDMLKGATKELRVGNPAHLSTYVGPVITSEARSAVEAHVQTMAARGCPVTRFELHEDCAKGTFMAPTLIELKSLDELTSEIFGPVLHIVRFQRDRLSELIAGLNAKGYALTFGVESRVDETIKEAANLIQAGNIYVNRNMIGAVVGTQPFGGHGLSGTGPKAGGPLYLYRFLSTHPPIDIGSEPTPMPKAAQEWIGWLLAQGFHEEANRCTRLAEMSMVGGKLNLKGPTGETNTYELLPRGTVYCRAQTPKGLFLQIGAALATGNRVLLESSGLLDATLSEGSSTLEEVATITVLPLDHPFQAVLYEGEDAAAFHAQIAASTSQIVSFQVLSPAALAGGTEYELAWLLKERVITVNTAAVGGNATLMTIG